MKKLSKINSLAFLKFVWRFKIEAWKPVLCCELIHLMVFIILLSPMHFFKHLGSTYLLVLGIFEVFFVFPIFFVQLFISIARICFNRLDEKKLALKDHFPRNSVYIRLLRVFYLHFLVIVTLLSLVCLLFFGAFILHSSPPLLISLGILGIVSIFFGYKVYADFFCSRFTVPFLILDRDYSYSDAQNASKRIADDRKKEIRKIASLTIFCLIGFLFLWISYVHKFFSNRLLHFDLILMSYIKISYMNSIIITSLLLYRILSAPYFDDMKGLDEIEIDDLLHDGYTSTSKTST